ncbi:response regulator [Wenzhouxiangella sp. XN79A]|uniref:GGDEF domain-containing response regulator n=1 Tax=Wenzhouxiangella sp. XN79A TaxID=2724193 RepID=UPI00144A5303|nr:response regulator [Wenzhouxiangella sp. XN79A]NKI33983.1 response regulator [Wenzhouxiangella sp. XN79A]
MRNTHDREHDAGAPRARVLFVDDSRLMRFAAQRCLEKRFDVVLAEDGEAGWRRLREDATIRAVITDLMMPRVDGVELIHRIRGATSDRLRQLPVLVVTSLEESDGRRAAIEAGANELVPKPFTESDLLDPVTTFLRQAEAEQNDDDPAMRSPNIERSRTGLLARMQQTLSLHDRLGLPWSLVHVRLLNRPEVSRRYGNRWGEALMRHLERVLIREVRIEDTVGRSGPETYTLVLPATSEEGAQILRSRLRRSLPRQPARFPSVSIDLDVVFSMQVPRFGDEAEALLEEGLARLDQPANVTHLPDRLGG